MAFASSSSATPCSHRSTVLRASKKRGVTYKAINDISELRPKLPDLPFLKRAPYSDEPEFRIVYVDHSEECEAKDFPIDLSCIRRITMNPWIAKPLLKSVRATIQSIKGCRELRVSRTTLLENERWKRAARGSKPFVKSKVKRMK